ncbi:MAG TPA: hypothetical protein PK095_01680 [Myxococcota bacterium]|nr:hypothetical protein [Myxococcota bacterium]
MIVPSLAALLHLTFGAPDLPPRDCVPKAPELSFPEDRTETVDAAVAARLSGLSPEAFAARLAKDGAVVGAGPRVFLKTATEGRYDAVELEGEHPIAVLRYGGRVDHELAPSGERRESHDVTEVPQGYIVNLHVQVVDGTEVVEARTRSHWVARRDGRGRLMATARCAMGFEEGPPAPRWTFGPTVQIAGCGEPVTIPASQLERCALAQGEGAKRASAYLDLANDVSLYKDVMQQKRILELALAATRAGTASEAQRHRGLWTRYGQALLSALSKDLPVSSGAVLAALENATLSEDTEMARSYAHRLLGDAYVVIADQTEPGAVEGRRGALESAIAAYERAQALYPQKATVARITKAKQQLASQR